MPLGLWKSKLVILREDMTQRDAEWRAEAREARLFNRELLIRLEKTYSNLGEALDRMGKRIDTNTEEVRAQTQAILKLVDRFEGPNGRQPD